MANSRKVKISRIYRKYDKLIEKAIEEYADRSIGELSEYLDDLKARMREEVEGVENC